MAGEQIQNSTITMNKEDICKCCDEEEYHITSPQRENVMDRMYSLIVIEQAAV